MFYKRNRNIIIAICIAIIFILIGLIYYFKLSTDEDIIINEDISKPIKEEISIQNKIHVDIKGAVVKPGVYEVDSNSMVNDVITLAGGLTKNATTKNINLSKKVFDEMVIYIFTNSELKVTTTQVACVTEVIEVNNCINKEDNKSNIDNSNKKININTATKEELLTLTGIGEAKADTIIEYRNTNKFTKIEDIMNISGIGESAFAKIKDSITV